MRVRTVLVNVATVVALAATPVAATVVTRYDVEPRHQPGPTTEQASPAAQQEASRYWTSQRMAEATPVSTERDKTQTLRATRELLGDEDSSLPSSPRSRASQHRAAPSAVAPQAAAGGLATTTAGAKWNGGNSVVPSIGLAYFTDGVGKMSCSAGVVNSQTGDLVGTAGHCCKLGRSFYKNWTFVPGHSAGEAPYGKWPARQLFTTTGWAHRQDDNEDVCFAALSTVNGQHISQVVGANAISFNASESVGVHSFGYPGPARRYNGVYYCAGITYPDNYAHGSTDVALPCKMEEGSSGGLMLANFNGTTGTVVSVNSKGYEEAPGVMMGPRFDSSIKRVYDVAQVS